VYENLVQAWNWQGRLYASIKRGLKCLYSIVQVITKGQAYDTV